TAIEIGPVPIGTVVEDRDRAYWQGEASQIPNMGESRCRAQNPTGARPLYPRSGLLGGPDSYTHQRLLRCRLPSGNATNRGSGKPIPNSNTQHSEAPSGTRGVGTPYKENLPCPTSSTHGCNTPSPSA